MSERGGPASCEEAAKRFTALIWRERPRTQAWQGAAISKTGGPDANKSVGGPARCEEAAKRRTALIWTVGPTLTRAWGDRPGVRRPRSGVPH
jgi:hypothetical protein